MSDENARAIADALERAEALRDAGAWAEAASLAMQAVQADANSARAWALLALVLPQMKQLEQADALKAEAERKRHYYGTSVKNDSYTNPNFSGARYEWNSRAASETSDERHFRLSPVSYNLFFASGMVVGFTIMIVTIYGTLYSYWPFPFVAVAVPGYILVREGWRGIMGKASWLGKLFKRR